MALMKQVDQQHELDRLRRWYSVSVLVFALVAINFVIFMIIANLIGGDAINGTIEDGRYYLWGYSLKSGAKGYTEVSESVFHYSEWHVYSIWITWPLAIVAAIVMNRLKTRIRRLERLFEN